MSSSGNNALIPAGARLVRTTPEFDEGSVPDGLLQAHQIAAGVWGRLVVREGSLVFAFEDAAGPGRHIGAGAAVVIPPERLHHVEVTGPVRFVVEFHRP